MEAIVAVDENWGIGYNNDLLCKISGDMKHFKELTQDKVNIVGLKTFNTFPKSYRNRIKEWVIFSKKFTDGIMDRDIIIEKPSPYPIIRHYLMDFYNFIDFCEYYKNKNIFCIPTLKTEISRYIYPDINNTFIFVGGETIYKHFYDDCFHKIYVTKIHKSFDKVNKYFPNVDKDRRFEITHIESHEENGIKYDFITYERKEMSVDREKFNQQLFHKEPWQRKYIKEFVSKSEETTECTSSISSDVPNPISLIVMMEEFSEAQKELSKFLRGKGDEEGLLEEMADVQICLFKYQKLFDISDETLNKAMCIKLDEFERKHPEYHLKEYIEKQIANDKEK